MGTDWSGGSPVGLFRVSVPACPVALGAGRALTPQVILWPGLGKQRASVLKGTTPVGLLRFGQDTRWDPFPGAGLLPRVPRYVRA